MFVFRTESSLRALTCLQSISQALERVCFRVHGVGMMTAHISPAPN